VQLGATLGATLGAEHEHKTWGTVADWLGRSACNAESTGLSFVGDSNCLETIDLHKSMLETHCYFIHSFGNLYSASQKIYSEALPV